MSVYSGPRTTSPASVDLLQDRVLLMATDPAEVAEIDPRHGGLVVAGAQAAGTVRSLRDAFPAMPLLIEPESASSYQATQDNPFLLSADDGLWPLTLRDMLDGQRQNGASLVVTPSGQVAAGDTPALKALINQANQVDDPDVLTLVPVAGIWLTPTHIRHLVAILKSSVHPVLLGVVNSDADPLSRQGALEGYARLAAEVPGLVAWRTDLSGLGALAHGAFAAVIGRRPSQRRYARLDKGPFASNLADKSPHVLMPGLMRYSRALWMRTEWFATAPSLTCLCTHCSGRDLDRFDASTSGHASAYLHNLAALNHLVGECLSSVSRRQWWADQMREAKSAHLELGNLINRQVPEPTYLERWLALSSV